MFKMADVQFRKSLPGLTVFVNFGRKSSLLLVVFYKSKLFL